MNNDEKLNDNDFCLNWGCIQDCIECSACNKKCLNYESRNTRLDTLNKIKNKNI